MRTGSNLLEANLNALAGVSCLGEVFNPHFIGRMGQEELFGITRAERDADPQQLLDRLREAVPGLPGLRFFHDHEPRVLPVLLADRGCAKIILTRNPLESYVSLKIARATGQWKLTKAKNLKSARARFDGAEFVAHVAALQAFQLQVLHALQASGQTAFYLDYEDLQDVAVLNGLAAWLGVEARLDAIDRTLVKQNPGDLAAKVENPEEMEAALARLDRFNLSRTPDFEPRRPPAIPSFVAAEGAGLLYMPVRCGPETAVRAWLSGLGGGGLTGDFVQKTLRQWKRRHVPHRSFTVLRHPLLRAHAAFREVAASPRRAELRQILNRDHKAGLPGPDKPFRDAAHEREAFLAFLRLARLATGGQGGPRVDPCLASQGAVLEGFTRFQLPDLVIREAQMAEGLAFLCAAIGIAAPPAPQPDLAAASALGAIWDPQLEAAAQDAYSRDYRAFGFGAWRE